MRVSEGESGSESERVSGRVSGCECEECECECECDHFEVHEVLCLPRNLHFEVHHALCLPQNLRFEVRHASAALATKSALRGSPGAAPAKKSAH